MDDHGSLLTYPPNTTQMVKSRTDGIVAKRERRRKPAASQATKPVAWLWETGTPQAYQQVIEGLVDFTFKTVNSNVAAGGVRLGPTAGLALPYVAARTMLGAGAKRLELDYVANSGKQAKWLKQAKALRDGSAGDTATDEERSAILAAFEHVEREPAEVGTRSVDARMRQLLIPKGSGYRTVSPVTSSGLCLHLFGSRTQTGLLEQHEQQRRLVLDRKGTRTNEEGEVQPGDVSPGRLSKIGRAHMGYGGSNPQNAGALVRSMQRPLFLPGPAGMHGPRAAWAIHHRGLPIPDCREALASYAAFRWRRRDDGGIDTRRAVRDEDMDHVAKIAAEVLAAGDAAHAVVVEHQNILPRRLDDNGTPSSEAELVSPKVRPRCVRGLIDPRWRDDDWAYDLAVEVTRHLETLMARREPSAAPLLMLDKLARTLFVDRLRQAFEAKRQ